MFEFKGIKQAKSQGNIPTDENGIVYVVQSMSNNMVSRKVNRQYLIDIDEAPVEGNCIVLGVTLPAISYQPNEFGASQVITARAPFLNNKNSLFFVNIINKHMYQFSYQNKPGIEIYKNLNIQLPITSTGEIDFAFMENFISELEEERISELNAYLEVTGLKDYTLTKEEEIALKEFSSLTWEEFRLGALFEKVNLKFKKNKFDKETDVSKVKTEKFSLPLVNAKDGDNGIMYYGKPEDFESIEMSIDIVGDGAVSTGNVYSQPQKTGVLYNAYLIKPNFKVTTEILHFCTSSIFKSIKLKYGYENKAGWEKVKNETILLPAKNNEPDYSSMETFISAIQKLIIKDVVLYADKKINTTKIITNKL